MTDKTTKPAKKPVAKKVVKKAAPAKKVVVKKEVVKKTSAPAVKIQTADEKKAAELLTKEAMRAFDAGAALPINLRVHVPTPVASPSTIFSPSGRPSITDLMNRIQTQK